MGFNYGFSLLLIMGFDQNECLFCYVSMSDCFVKIIL